MMRRLIPMLSAIAMTGADPAAAQQVPGPYGPQVTLAEARAIVDAAHLAAKAHNFTMAFAVALPSGEPILLEVMDGTQSASIAISQAKARTAARFRRTTKFIADTANQGNVGMLSADGAIAVEGGVPILSNGRVIGAIGVSGGTSAQDGEIAALALTQTDAARQRRP